MSQVEEVVQLFLVEHFNTEDVLTSQSWNVVTQANGLQGWE